MAGPPYEDPRDPHWYVLSVRDMLREHDARIDKLDLWRAELNGMVALVKFAIGTSVISAGVSILSVIDRTSR